MKKCKHCDKEFEPSRPDYKYCSEDCRTQGGHDKDALAEYLTEGTKNRIEPNSNSLRPDVMSDSDKSMIAEFMNKKRGLATA